MAERPGRGLRRPCTSASPGVIEQCPTCGAAVRVASGDEGTSHYKPITAIDALAKEVAPLSRQLQEAVERDVFDTVKANGERAIAERDTARVEVARLRDAIDAATRALEALPRRPSATQLLDIRVGLQVALNTHV